MCKKISMVVVSIVLTFSSFQLRAEDHPAQTLVVESITSMLDVLKNEKDRIKTDPEFLKAKVDELIVPSLDFNAMTILAVGKFWRKMDIEQKTELVTEFKKFMLSTYTSYLTEYSGERINFEPFRPGSREDRAVVRSKVSQSAGSDVMVNFRLRDSGGWSIVDIETQIDGNWIKLVVGQRPGFAKEIEKGGITGLINTLKERNSKS